MALFMLSGFDFYRAIKLVNFIRQQTLSAPLQESETFKVPEIPVFTEDEQYLQPVLLEDPLLSSLGDFVDDNDDEDGDNTPAQPTGSQGGSTEAGKGGYFLGFSPETLHMFCFSHRAPASDSGSPAATQGNRTLFP